MGVMRVVYGRLPYELSIVELEPTEAVECGDYRVAAVPVQHKAQASYGYVILEDARPGHLDARLARAARRDARDPTSAALQSGETVDGVSPEQVMGPGRQGRKIVLSGDTAPCEALAIAAHQADLLVHEATFADEEATARARPLTAPPARRRKWLATPRCGCSR